MSWCSREDATFRVRTGSPTGTYGYVCNDSNCDPEDFLEEDETEEDLIFEGKRPLGAMYFDRWDKNGEFYQGGCFLYYEGETVKDWCDRNGEPYPVKYVGDKKVESMKLSKINPDRVTSSVN